MSEDKLWEGISIMSPQEMEEISSNKSETDDSSEAEETKENQNSGENEDLTIAPVSTETERGIDNEENNSEVENSNEEGKESSEDLSEKEEQQLNAYSALIQDMIDEGVLSAPDGEELQGMLKNANGDTIKELIKHTANEAFRAKHETWKQSLDSTKKKFLEIEDAFTDTDHAIQMAQKLDYLENISEEAIKDDTELQKQIIYEDLKSRNFTHEEILESIEEADALDKLETKALKSFPALKKNTAEYVETSRKKQEADRQRLQEQYKESFDKMISSIEERDEFIPGLKLNKIAKEKIKQNITTPVYKDEQGNELTSLMYKQKRSPQEFQMLINYYDSIGLFNLDKSGKFNPDISKIKNVAKTKAVSELDKVIAREDQQGAGRAHSGGGEQTESIINFLKGAMDKRK